MTVFVDTALVSDGATIAANIIKALGNCVLSRHGHEQFAKDWAASGQTSL